MNKPSQIRELLSSSIATLKQNPENLHVFIEEGNIAATAAGGNLSFEYQFTCVIIVTDFNEHADNVIIPLLGWITKNQPELLENPELRETGFQFKAELLNHATFDLEIKLKLTERVKVTEQQNALHVEHLPEPIFEDNIDWTLFTNGTKTPWPPTT
ncbi:phage tail protein [Pseudoalteromonas sp. MMG013]|uniref:phage tail protein n=1 Tax=Pseudoalteromonas sp. MMG013 TaxID=2822687 RepID=UPI001B37FBB7|nr:phage tail protein [Pseudoalteromonas sp. MMG013]MBQ4864608.1 phage tail protein [Pseudoalteromonas sp. MMG013]